jgi:hypothetical protein
LKKTILPYVKNLIACCDKKLFCLHTKIKMRFFAQLVKNVIFYSAIAALAELSAKSAKWKMHQNEILL